MRESSGDQPTNHTVEHTIEEIESDGTITLDVDPAAVVRLYVDNDQGKADYNGDNGVWHGLDGEEDFPIENNARPGKKKDHEKKGKQKGK